VCSTGESALRRVAEAIDQLDADRKGADLSRLEAQIAAIWAMVGEIDPELGRLVSGYATPARSNGDTDPPDGQMVTASRGEADGVPDTGNRRGPVAGKPTGYPSLGLAGDKYPADEPE